MWLDLIFSNLFEIYNDLISSILWKLLRKQKCDVKNIIIIVSLYYAADAGFNSRFSCIYNSCSKIGINLISTLLLHGDFIVLYTKKH